MQTPDNMSMEDVAEKILIDPQAEDAEVVEEEETEEPTPDDEVSGEAEDISDDQSEDDPEEDDDGPDDEEAPDLYTVTIDGEQARVTLDELRNGYSGQSFIQKGMKENAEARRLVMQEAENLRQARDEFFSLQQQVQDNGYPVPPEPPSDELIQSDPIGYLEAQSKYQAESLKYQQDVQAIEHQRQLAAQQYQQQFAAHVENQANVVKQEIPELADPEKGGEVLRDLRAKGMDYGFSEQELAGLYDSRMVRVLNDARKWQNLQASKTAATKKAEGARPVVKPGSKARPVSKKKQRAQLRDKLRKTGSVADAVALILDE